MGPITENLNPTNTNGNTTTTRDPETGQNPNQLDNYPKNNLDITQPTLQETFENINEQSPKKKKDYK